MKSGRACPERNEGADRRVDGVSRAQFLASCAGIGLADGFGAALWRVAKAQAPAPAARQQGQAPKVVTSEMVMAAEKITGLDFAPLFRDMFESKRISGRGNLHIKATAAGKDTDAMLRTLNGTLGFQVDNGAIEGTDLWYEIRRARALLKQQALPERTGPERTAFTALSASGKITNGVVVSDDIVAALQYLRVTGKGSTDIVKGELDYRLDATVLKLPPEGAGAEMADVVGFVVPVRITGALTDPKVRPDLGALAKAAVQQKIEEKKQEVEDKLKEQLQDKLKGLFER